MFCDKCNRIIRPGEHYFALTVSKERAVDGVVSVEYAQLIKCVCRGCYTSGVEVRLSAPSEN